MKFSIALAAAITAFLAGRASNAESLHPDTFKSPDYTFVIEKMDIADGSSLAGLSYRHGTVTVDLAAKKIELTLHPVFRCPPRRMCAMVMPAPRRVELPIVSVGHGFCGGIFVHAGIDSSPRDGLVQELVLTHPGYNPCTQKIDSTVEITYREYSVANGLEAVSKFSGFIREEIRTH